MYDSYIDLRAEKPAPTELESNLMRQYAVEEFKFAAIMYYHLRCGHGRA